MLVVLVPVGPPRLTQTLLQLGSPWRFIEELNTELGRLLVWTTLVAALLGVGASLLLGRLLAQPLQRLAQTARQVAGGDLTARTGLPGGRSEIRAVASAFDEMVTRLEESFSAQKRFVADASHELKTPLTAIAGMAELLEQATPEERQRALATLQREVGRMSRLVEELLSLSRAEEGSLPGSMVQFDAADMLAEVAESAALVDPSHPLELSVHGALPLVGDREALTRAVRNLVDNALKHSPPGAPVTIEGLAGPGEIRLRVRDRGPGIAAEDLPHVFARFYRADRSRSRHTGGSGLGLAIVRAVVEAHHGRAELRNPPEGGLEATVVLPSGDLQKPPPASSASTPTMNPQAEPDEEEWKR
jgi:two-component system OmpR family sensor kinase